MIILPLLRLLASAIGIIGLSLGVWLAVVCHTLQGRLFATAGLWLACALISWGLFPQNPVCRQLTKIAFIAFVLFSLLVILRAPDGKTAESSRIQQRYAGNSWNFRRLAFGNLLPEVDQYRLGFQVVPAVDPFFTRKQARHLTQLTTSIYDDLESDPGFRALGSAMPEAYDELWGLNFQHGHYYLYIPPGLDRSKPQPAIVFLHGSGGNFKAYTWLLSKVADKLQMVVIAPSFGMGNWFQPNTSKLVAKVLEDASHVVKLDQLHLMGLSNGALGVSQCGAQPNPPFSSFTFLSPVFDDSAIAETDWSGRQVLVITGTADDRVPFEYVQQTVNALTRTGVHVDFHPVTGADHFMLFSHETQVLQNIESWLREVKKP